MKPKLLLGLALVLSGGLFVWPNILRAQTNSNSEYQLELSLRATSERGRGGQSIEIFVKNISTNEVEISSKSATTQQWSVYFWFKWQIDGKEAQFGESIALIRKKMETWLIPPGGEIRWAAIGIDDFGNRGWIKDSKHHTVTILPSDDWGNLKVKGATITILGSEAETNFDFNISLPR